MAKKLKQGMNSFAVKTLQRQLTKLGYPLKDDGLFGSVTAKVVKKFQADNKLVVSGVVGEPTQAVIDKKLKALNPPNVPPKPADPVIPPVNGPAPYYWEPLVIQGVDVHPIFKLPKPYTHLHPIDLLRAVAGEKEILGSKDNVLIAHFHEHSPNLASPETGGSGDAKNNYHDEVPHCMSAQNWAQDGSGCFKSKTALASSGEHYAELHGSRAYKIGDMIPEGALICINGHITRANKAFKWTGQGSFEGFGSNQGNTIKTSVYPQSRIRTICDDKPKPGTVLAPIGILGHKPVPVQGGEGESTR